MSKCLDFSSGLVTLRFCGTAAGGGLQTYVHNILLPADAFLKAFRQPAAIAAKLDASAKEVTREWQALNGDAASAGRRTPIETAYTLWRVDWKQNFQLHFGEVELQVRYYLDLLPMTLENHFVLFLDQHVWFHRG